MSVIKKKLRRKIKFKFRKLLEYLGQSESKVVIYELELTKAQSELDSKF